MSTTGATSPVSRRRAETRDRLLVAAIDVFARIGVDQARVEDISEQAGYTRGAFYSNFADKADLIVALLQRQGELASQVVRTSIGQVLAGPRPDGFEALVNAALDAFADNIPTDNWLLAEMSLRFAAMRDPELGKHLEAFERQQRATLVATLEAGLDEIGMRSLLPIEHLVTVAMAVHSDAMLRERVGVASVQERQVLVSILERCLEPID